MIKDRISIVLAAIGCLYIFITAIHNFSEAGAINDAINGINDSIQEERKNVPFNGIENAEWCQAPKLPSLPYEDCEYDDFVFRFGVRGGLTNVFNFLLKGAIWAFEEGVCFVVDESVPNRAPMAARESPIPTIDPFLVRYFELIGLSPKHSKVKDAYWHKRFAEPGYHQIQNHEYRHGRGGGLLPRGDERRHFPRDIKSLDIVEKDNIWVKKHILRRMFKILPRMQGIACDRLSKLGLQKEYMAMSVRRGDKVTEFELASIQPYIDRAEIGIKTHFNGIPPKIFVASDDCGVMKELRALRPRWVFVSECDNASEDNGFVLSEMKHWTLEQTDAHYEKFVTEMIALASGKYFIGVSNTNVSIWVYYMRHMDATDDSWFFVDTDDLPH